MTPFFFGQKGRRLYGVWHPASKQAVDARAVLICYPFGQEYVRCHRLLRVLAERLSSQGYATLRFDYAGTGDSEGADEQSRLAGWVEDVKTAHVELARRVGGAPIVWLGVRLGGTAALLARRLVEPPPAGLVLWEPIGSGTQYLTYLAGQHRQALEAAFAIPPVGLPTGEGDEVLGFGLGEDMVKDLRALSPTDGSMAPDALPARYVLPTEPTPWLALPPRAASGTTVRLTHPFEWNAEEALDSALVPAEFVTLLADACVSLR